MRLRLLFGPASLKVVGRRLTQKLHAHSAEATARGLLMRAPNRDYVVNMALRVHGTSDEGQA